MRNPTRYSAYSARRRLGVTYDWEDRRYRGVLLAPIVTERRVENAAMQSKLHKPSRGFTLVELVVVILILGILAGVAAPRLLDTAGQATDNGLRQTLAVVRDAIELHMAQVGRLPSCTGAGSDFRTELEPFIRGVFPDAPVGTNQDNSVTPASGTTTPDGATGWMFYTDTGEFIVNTTATDNLGTAYSTY